jgi:hypothetical protein
MSRPIINLRTVTPFLVGVVALAAADGAFAGARASASRCAISGPMSPVPSTAAPPADVLARFGVLARPAATVDQIPIVNNLGIGLAGQLGSYDSAYVRFLAPLTGSRQLFVIPGTAAKLVLPPLSCVPAKERAPLAQAIHEQAKVVAGPIYCLAVIGGPGIFPDQNSSCVPFGLERNGYAIDSVGANTIGDPSRTLAGLVPDGVSSVQLSFFGAPRLNAPVGGNAFVATGVFRHLDAVERRDAAIERHNVVGGPTAAGRLLARRFLRLQRQVAAAAIPTHVRWIGPAGQVIATFTAPSGRLAQEELGTLSSFTVSNGSGQSSFGSGVGLAPAL